MSIVAPEADQIFTAEKRRAVEDISLKKDAPYQLSLYGDYEHGFALRCDLKD
jgi:hypothetical protein